MEIVRSAKRAGSRLWTFELITPAGEVCGGGVVDAPSASTARSHALLLLAGGNDVRLVEPEARPEESAADVALPRDVIDAWVTRFSPYVQ